MPYGPQIFLGVVVFVVVAFVLWFGFQAVLASRLASRHRRMMSHKDAAVEATIIIDASGGHSVELVPTDNVHAVDMIQLANSYIANQLFVTLEDHPFVRQSLVELTKLCVQYDEAPDKIDFLQALNDLVSQTPSTKPLSTTYTAGDSEKYVAKLVRGNNMDYVLADFAMRVYQPNLMNSAIFLFADIAEMLDKHHLRLLVKSLLVTLQVFYEKGVGAGDNQYVSYIAVEQGMTIFGGGFDCSPARPRHDR